MVGSPGQQNENDLLRDTALRLPVNPEGERVRWKDRYMVDRYNDVRDAGRVEPLQDYHWRGADKDCQGWDQHPILRVRVQGGKGLPGQVSEEEPQRPSDD
jgi:hypothetical protein